MGLSDPQRFPAPTRACRARPPRRQRVSYARPGSRARRNIETFSGFRCGRCQRGGRAGRLRQRVDWTDHPGIRLYGLELRAVQRFAIELHGVVEFGPEPDRDREDDVHAAGCATSARAATPGLPARSRAWRCRSQPTPFVPAVALERPAGGVDRSLTVRCRDAFVQAAGASAAAALRYDRRRIARLALRTRNRRPGAQAPRSCVQRRLPTERRRRRIRIVWPRWPHRCAMDLDRSSPTPTEPPTSEAGTTRFRRRGGRPPPCGRTSLLLIDHGTAASTLDCLSCWGATLGGVIDPARSALGIQANRHLIWAGAEHATVRAIADALLSAGVVRAVELDINPEWVAGYLYGHRGGPGPLATIPGRAGPARHPRAFPRAMELDDSTITAR